ncbi:MAG: type II toxin-antitoxin system VapC family toxin [Hydrogenovibrio sp.]|uniref:type II toxin-antitoxin system tRNA(fMet)-specific endonuclease VapC n=1 Tax=Hydrogenovibrio sp. TaxID=2065821 RepID=UPI00286FEB4F|nr:type II toxin-antitoxin system VapC family toxin [Hydrogenovibrio sp.]MDR9499776.1 type II toxin-antitoxin system VapC family toxin [Hydrogenovibrio sp.]
MQYLLDTNICIYIVKRKPLAVLERFEKMPIGAAGISLITYGELEFGALKSQQSQKAQGILDELVAYLPVLPMENEVAAHYADIRANLEARGRPIGNNDLWIAAHARALDLILVSNNIKEFERVENLKLENWV